MRFQHTSLMVLAVLGGAWAQEKPLRFSGEVKAGQTFRKPIGRGLLFVLKADDDGWLIEVQPETAQGQRCRNFSTVIATPLRGYTGNDLNVSYGLSAAEAMKRPQREVAFVLDEAACKQESERANRLMWPNSYSPEQVREAQEKFGSSAGGTAILRIVDSKVSPSGDLADGKDPGKIDWIKFDVQVTFSPKN